MLLQEAQWFSVDYGQAGYHMKDMFENYKGYAEKAWLSCGCTQRGRYVANSVEQRKRC